MRKTCAVHVQLESLLLVLRLLYRSCANSLISFSSFSIVRLLAYVWQRMENSLPDRGLEESTGQSRGLQLRLRLASAMADGMTGHSLVLPPSASRVKKKAGSTGVTFHCELARLQQFATRRRPLSLIKLVLSNPRVFKCDQM